MARRSDSRTLLCTGVLGLVLVASTSRETRAIPATALSRSLRQHPQLINDVALVFAYPQRATLDDGQALSVNELSSTTFVGLGVLARARSHGLFFVAEPNAEMSDDTMMQMGWGFRAKALRGGLSYRRGRRENGNDEFTESGFETRVRRYQLEREAWLGAAGIGVDSDALSFDATFELFQNDTQYESQRIDPDSSHATFQNEQDVSWGVAGRLTWRGQHGAQLVLFGRWRDQVDDLRGVSFTDGLTLPLHFPARLPTWAGGVALRFPSRRIDFISFSSYIEYNETQDIFASTFSASLRLDRTRTAAIAFSLEENIWRTLVARAGIEVRYVELEQENISPAISSAFQSQNLFNDVNLDEIFGWGVSYGWKRLQARAALQATLPISNLITTLDVLLGF